MRNYTRSSMRPEGTTMLEMLVAIVVIGVAIAGITELMWVNATWSTRMLNKTDNLNSAKFFMSRLGKDVRSSKNIGDALHQSTSYVSPLATYTSGGDTLILQIPLVDSNGFPLSNGVVCDVDTVVYRLKADARDSSGQTYQMFKSTFRGVSDAAAGDVVDQVVQNDVVGPLDKITGKPAVFQYISSAGNEIPITQVVTSYPAASTVSGIAVNLELNKTGDSTNSINVNSINRSNFVMKSEFFLRNKLLPG